MSENCDLNFNGIYITHAMGEIDGVIYTNSRDAFLLNYQRGCRVFEVDFDLVDNHLICCHDENKFKEFVKNKDYTYENFINSKLLGKYTTLDIRGLNQLLDEYQDVLIVTDTKYSDAERVTKIFQIIKTECAQNLARIIPQIYNQAMYEAVTAVCSFNYIIFTLYQIEHWNAEDIAQFCAKKQISAVTMWHYLLNPKIAGTFHQSNVKICTHTVNDQAVVKKLQQIGCDYFYSDNLTD